MRSFLGAVAGIVLAASCARADIYMHNPRGSNNRAQKGNGNRNNANRLFDSENNDAGGYGMGGSADNPAPPLKFIVGSELTIEWTSQHSCGHGNAHCQFIFQYYCNDDSSDGQQMRDGTSDQTIDINNPTDQTRGLHEPLRVYEECRTRERNKGLWTADQEMSGRNKAVHTRQERNENRHGFECPEERDYYPYWHKSVWKDIAVLTTDPERCAFYKEESFNVKAKNECSKPQHNNERACVTDGGEWITVPPHGIDPPICTHAPWLRDNHLGSSANGRQTMFNWTIPDEVSSACVLRGRYNISTRETPWDLDSKYNGGQSPIKGNPRVDIGFGLGGTLEPGNVESQLALNVNTNQFGRTFQDRSFVFEIIPRPPGIPRNAKIYNINVRGKRGNIVQSYPAVEYDFSPKVVSAPPGSWMHFQWTGNDRTANNGNNNGEGTADTDRHNIVQIEHPNSNRPLHKDLTTMFDVEAEMTTSGLMNTRSRDDLIKAFALVYQTNCRAAADLDPNNNADQEAADNCEKLNDASATVDLGLLKLKPGTYHYMSTRNNNFSNRSQKGVIHVQPNPPPQPHINHTETVGVDGIRITWSMPPQATAEGAIDASEPVEVDAYLVEMSDDGGETWLELGTFDKTNATSRGNSTVQDAYSTRSLEVRELPAGLTHTFRVSAANADGWGASSEPVPVMTPDSERSRYFKLLLRNAVKPYHADERKWLIAGGCGFVFILIAYMTYTWHTTGSIVPTMCHRMWRICRYGSPVPPSDAAGMLDPSKPGKDARGLGRV